MGDRERTNRHQLILRIVLDAIGDFQAMIYAVVHLVYIGMCGNAAAALGESPFCETFGR